MLYTLPWDYHEITMGLQNMLPWDFRGVTLGLPWVTIGLPWSNPRAIMCHHGTSMG
jgi:hypothetical protein